MYKTNRVKGDGIPITHLHRENTGGIRGSLKDLILVHRVRRDN